MKLQIWKISVVEGVMGMIHGHSYSIYEGYVPDLKLTINHVTSFVNEDDSKRYEARNDEEKEGCVLDQHDPELIYEVELSRAQIEDVKMLAQEENPYDRMSNLVGSLLKERDLEADDYIENEN